MKYRILKLKITVKSSAKRTLKAKRHTPTSICPYRPLPEEAQYEQNEQIIFDSLFAIGALPEAEKPSLGKRMALGSSKFAAGIKKLFASAWRVLKRIARNVFGSPSRTPSPTAFFAGTMCAAVCVTVISALTVLVGLFGSYFAPYEEIVIPSFVGETYDSLEQNSDGRLEFLVSYKNSEEVAAGVVMSQQPSAGVTRKLFRTDKYCAVTVTVSAGRHFYAIEDLSGLSERDAVLALRNSGVAVNIITEHSETVPMGNVISTEPAAGQRLFDDEELTLYISLGKEIPMVSVPDLYALSEAQALSALETRGLKVGKITYATSDIDAGKVIAQQYPAYSKIQKDSTVDITVSLGNGYTQKTVPDLYGLTVEQAEQRLAQFGLVIGSIYSVTSGAPAGTVVTQTPIAGTPINSTVISVDIYVSS